WKGTSFAFTPSPMGGTCVLTNVLPCAVQLLLVGPLGTRLTGVLHKAPDTTRAAISTTSSMRRRPLGKPHRSPARTPRRRGVAAQAEFTGNPALFGGTIEVFRRSMSDTGPALTVAGTVGPV